MFVCPPVESPALIQVLSEDGAAWRVVEAPEGACLYRVDDQEEARLMKQWEGKRPADLLALPEGVVAVGDRWLVHLNLDGQRWIGGGLPRPAERVCEQEGELRVEAGGQSWRVVDSHLVGPLPEVCSPDPAQVPGYTDVRGTR